MRLLSKIFGILNLREKRIFIVLIFSQVISMILEVLSIGAIIPLISSLTDSNSNTFSNLFKNIQFINFDNLVNLEIKQVIFLVIAIFLLKNLYLSFSTWFKSYFLNNISKRLSFDLFNYYLKIPYEKLSQRNSSELLNNITEIVDTFKESLGNIVILISETIIFIGIFSFLLLIEPLAVSVIAIISFTIGLVFYFINKSNLTKWGNERNIGRENKIQNTIQGINSIKIIKILGNFENFIRKFDFYNNKENKYNHYSYTLVNLPRYIFEFSGILLISFLFLFLHSKNFSNSEIIMFLGIVVVASFRILPAIARLTNSISLLRFYKFSVDIIFKELSQNNNIKFHQKLETNTEKVNFEKIELKNVFFKRIDDEKNSLKNINFTLSKGDYIGIKGSSGSGKTTFVDILCGLLKPSQGKIICNDKIDITNFSNTTPIKIGYIPQNIHLTNSNLKSNIAFGVHEEQIDENKIINILKICKLDKFYSGSKILEKPIGDDGIKLSGGEKQRIGIARALYQDPDLFIFDEFTSSLDQDTEKKIIDNLNIIKKDKTFVIISHRDTALLNCSQVYLCENNKIIAVK